MDNHFKGNSTSFGNYIPKEPNIHGENEPPEPPNFGTGIILHRKEITDPEERQKHFDQTGSTHYFERDMPL